jgi:hypothetical protein
VSLGNCSLYLISFGPPLASLSLTLVKGELGVNLGGNSTGDDLEELLTETDEESVHGVLGLLFLVTVHQLSCGQVASGKRGMCGGQLTLPSPYRT